MIISAKRIALFWKKVLVGDPDECWPWTGVRPEGTYGVTSLHSKHTYAHRLSYMIVIQREIPQGIIVRHTCDNKPCCNPWHLIGGTYKQNSEDMVRRGRSLTGDRNPSRAKRELLFRGSDHHQAILEESQVLAIAKRYALGDISQMELAKQYGVSRPTIAAIVVGINWQQLGIQKLPRRKYVAVQGETHGMARLSADDIVAIRALRRDGMSYYAIGKQYNLNRSHVRRIVLGLSWKNTK